MTTKEIANKLVSLCREGEFEKAQKELYSQDAVSIEPQASPDFQKETKGLNNILQKGEKFKAMVDQVHGNTVSEPLVTGNSIAFTISMDVTMKGKRSTMSELCVYGVKDGKVVLEEFFM
jgi:hypothetical protein